MKFLVLLLATAALASASVVGRKNFDIKEDGTIVIKGDHGKQILISKEHGPFEKNIEIEVTGPNALAKKIHITDENQIEIEGAEHKVHSTYDDIHQFQEDRYKRSFAFPTERQLLEYFFKEYQTVVDEKTFYQFFAKVQEAVKKGHISPYFLNFFQTKYFTQFHHDQQYNNNKWGVYEEEYKYTPFWYKYFYGNQFQQQNFYGKDAQEVLKHVFVQFFDEQVFVNALKHYGIFNQVVFDHVYDETVFDKIFTTEGIFDQHFLVELIKDQYIRKTLVEQGIFNETVLEQLLYILNTHGVEAVYGHNYLEQLVNKPLLKYWFFQQGFFKYVLQHVFYHYNDKHSYEYEFMVQLVKNPMYRDFFAQHGIFHTEVLKQLYYVWKTQGFYSQALLEQLVNKQVLKQFLNEYFTFDQYTLDYFFQHEILGLKYLMQSKFFQSEKMPKFNYKQWSFEYPEFKYENTYKYHPFVNVDFKKTVFKPFHHDFEHHFDFESEYYPTKYQYENKDYFYGKVYDDKTNYYWKNFFYGKPEYTNQYYNKYQGYYQQYYPTTYGNYGTTYGKQHGVYNYNQVPLVEHKTY